MSVVPGDLTNIQNPIQLDESSYLMEDNLEKLTREATINDAQRFVRRNTICKIDGQKFSTCNTSCKELSKFGMSVGLYFD